MILSITKFIKYTIKLWKFSPELKHAIYACINSYEEIQHDKEG